MTRRVFWQVGVALGLLLAPVSSIGAADDLADAIASRAAGAALVVIGEPLGQESRWEDGGIWTYTEVAVRRAIGAGGPDTVVVRQRGGTVGRIGQRVSHVRLLDPRRPHLLFLWPDDHGASWIPGTAGVLPIDLGLDGLERVEGTLLAPIVRSLEGLR